MENKEKNMTAQIRLYTIDEAIEAQLVIGLTKWRLRELCKNAEIKCFKAGRRYLFTAEDLFEAIRK